jgi:hypothetical protein
MKLEMNIYRAEGWGDNGNQYYYIIAESFNHAYNILKKEVNINWVTSLKEFIDCEYILIEGDKEVKK